MTLYVIRHGQTELNAQGVIQGTLDEELNAEGRRQAEALVPFFQDKTVDCIYSSPRKRAKQTADILNKRLQLPLHEDERLVERAFGALEGQPYSALQWDVSNDRPKFFLDDYCVLGAEPMQTMYSRIDHFLQALAGRPYQAVILVTHGGVAAYLTKRFSDTYPENAVSLNGEISQYFLEKAAL